MPQTLTNQLADQSSPYLLQHADNPVAWQPWSDDAFDLARRENKPVFLSVGYSTCHWCHVMAHESFEDDAVAAVLNEHFVPIKVDREELPDVDAQYMLATQAYYALAGNPRGGGWPNSVWLLPDGRPFFAGTYFPKPQFIALLDRLNEHWHNEPEQIEHNASVITQYMQQLAGVDAADDVTLDQPLIDQAVTFITRRFDPTHGGFGSAPKFPPHGALKLLAAEHRRTHDDDLLKMFTATLNAMRRGGVYDHVGGGFHRYATDARWFLPHFEKMLYDNAQLIRAYADGCLLAGDEQHRAVIDETVDWLQREMTDAGGAFHAAIDADSEGQEGKFYVWHINEIRKVLGDDADLFIKTYNIQPDGNWTDEATGDQPGTNIPFLEDDVPANQRERLTELRTQLRQVRDQRVHPHLDDKVLVSWNGLMIAALAYAGRQLDAPRYTDAAKKAATFILNRMRQDDGTLRRVYRAGRTAQPGYLDDYAYMIDALVELYETTGENRWLDEARTLAGVMIDRFEDPAAGGFFFTANDHDGRVLRSKNPSSGGNMPSPNGVAAEALMRLGKLTGDANYTAAGYRTLCAFAGLIKSQPYAADDLLVALVRYLDDPALQQQAADARASESQPIVTATADAPANVAPGESFTATVNVTIAPPYHIYGPNVETSGLTPTQLGLLDGNAQIQSVRFPAPESMPDPLGRSVGVYAGSLTLAAELTLDDQAAGEQTLILRLQCQPCDDRACLQSMHIDLPVKVHIGQAT